MPLYMEKESDLFLLPSEDTDTSDICYHLLKLYCDRYIIVHWQFISVWYY